ncbi:sulfotransferase [Pseudooceanicola sediminis]|uniref:Sulfotransferase n=1 Tax=Pseudooceanicola sediminis TaxID=2211117 RepID=A0A399J1G8_9RHOB|nr:sulfotransferase [Puniceibacterium sp. HSS470]RII39061.1 sulfotransferase [Pseudooceanicola sediminis]
MDTARTQFSVGQISACWQGIAPLLQPSYLAALPRPRREALQYLQLGCALFQQGDLAAARHLNATLPVTLWTPMRYRLSLRLRDPATARRLRKAPGNGPRELADFRTSAGLHALWAHRYAQGFPLYAHRHAAINFPRVLPANVTHVPLPADPGDDADMIVLEQGLGDVLFHLAHIKAQGTHQRAIFTGMAKYGPLIRRYFPQATFLRADRLPATTPLPRAHLAADFLARTYGATHGLSPGVTLDTPTRHAFDGPVFGICWRGGSGQNRREERHIALPFLLDMLPENARYLALQFDITPAERAQLTADGRCAVPLTDITRNPAETIDMIRPLAGMISVDSANWHMAGFSGVPLLAIMNRTAHWFWGPNADAATVFANAQTLPKADLSPQTLRNWITARTHDWQRRVPAPLPAPNLHQPASLRPLFVCGLPRARTSMVMRVLAAQGLWLGHTIPGNPDNPQGFYENRDLRETHLKGILSDLGADPRGVAPLPRTSALPPCPDLARRIAATLRDQGHDGTQPWGFKDPKLTLLWPLFARAYPHATWLIVRRPRKDVLRSLARAHFMQRHPATTEFWQPFCAAYDGRLHDLVHSGAQVLQADSDAIANGDFRDLEAVCAALGLPFDADLAHDALRRP